MRPPFFSNFYLAISREEGLQCGYRAGCSNHTDCQLCRLCQCKFHCPVCQGLIRLYFFIAAQIGQVAWPIWVTLYWFGILGIWPTIKKSSLKQLILLCWLVFSIAFPLITSRACGRMDSKSRRLGFKFHCQWCVKVTYKLPAAIVPGCGCCFLVRRGLFKWVLKFQSLGVVVMVFVMIIFQFVCSCDDVCDDYISAWV